MLSEIYWSFFTTSVISFLIVIIRMGYKSKCKSCRCCGCELIRDVEGEEKLDQLEIERHPETKTNINNI